MRPSPDVTVPDHCVRSGIMDTMDSSGLYLDVTEFAHDTPSWVQHLAEVWTELGLLLFGVLFVVAWWRARRGDPRAVAVAVLAPLGTALAYVISETVKSFIEEERPCRAVSGALKPLVECPPHGDWSFPSNHSTIAGAAAVGLALAWPRIAALTLPMAVLMAFSRVFVGVHYPHDVAVGLVLGAVVVFLSVKFAARPVTRITEAMRGSRTGVVRWFAGAGAGAAVAPDAGAGQYVPSQAGQSGPGGQYENSLPYRPARAEQPPEQTMTLRRHQDAHRGQGAYQGQSTHQGQGAHHGQGSHQGQADYEGQGDYQGPESYQNQGAYQRDGAYQGQEPYGNPDAYGQPDAYGNPGAYQEPYGHQPQYRPQRPDPRS